MKNKFLFLLFFHHERPAEFLLRINAFHLNNLSFHVFLLLFSNRTETYENIDGEENQEEEEEEKYDDREEEENEEIKDEEEHEENVEEDSEDSEEENKEIIK